MTQTKKYIHGVLVIIALAALVRAGAADGWPAHAQTTTDGKPQAPAQGLPPSERPPIRVDLLRGEYGRYRANNDLRFYHLDIRIDPGKKWVSGRNTIRFRMLEDDTRIQLDLFANLTIDRSRSRSSSRGPSVMSRGNRRKPCSARARTRAPSSRA